MGRFVLVFALGVLCALVAIVGVMGYWAVAAVVLGIGVAAVLLWALIGGTGAKAVVEADRVDADLERGKTAQYMMRNKSQPGGGA